MYREYLDSSTSTTSTHGAISTRTRSAICRTVAGSATGTTSAASATSSETASSPRSCSRTRSRRSFRASCSSRGRRSPTSTSIGSPVSVRTTAGSPTSCARYPERRAGIGQIFLNDVDEAIKDIHFIADNGLRGGVLISAIPPDVDYVKPLYDPMYDPIWAGVPRARAPGQQPRRHRARPTTASTRCPRCCSSTRCRSTRSGRSCSCCCPVCSSDFRSLKFVMTEMGCAWLPPMLRRLDRSRSRSARRAAPASCAIPKNTCCRSRRPSTSVRTAGSVHQPTRSRRCRGAPQGRARPVHVGERLSPQRRHLPVHP